MNIAAHLLKEQDIKTLFPRGLKIVEEEQLSKGKDCCAHTSVTMKERSIKYFFNAKLKTNRARQSFLKMIKKKALHIAAHLMKEMDIGAHLLKEQDIKTLFPRGLKSGSRVVVKRERLLCSDFSNYESERYLLLYYNRGEMKCLLLFSICTFLK